MLLLIQKSSDTIGDVLLEVVEEEAVVDYGVELLDADDVLCGLGDFADA